uniref:Uncharacterized protein n=1 Tax=Phage sp. ctIHi3 TaxID=2825791 RepID=A0A8S5Q5R9_9VIRU|nr:MAG TPA: hypothetical protein [Phage sp. ctIHi3]DAJ10426.1 MAG TPA: hypothetical protein [Caudoviricetes sp.]
MLGHNIFLSDLPSSVQGGHSLQTENLAAFRFDK